MRRVRIGEQQVELSPPKLRGDRRPLSGDLLPQLAIVVRQLVELDDIARAPFEPVPCVDELAVLRGLAGEVTRAVGIVPDAGLG